MFHFGDQDGEEEKEPVLSLRNDKESVIVQDPEEETKTPASDTLAAQNKALKDFLLQKSRESLRFAHLMFWCILASLDDT